MKINFFTPSQARGLKDPAGMLEEFHSGYLLQHAARDEQPLKV